MFMMLGKLLNLFIQIMQLQFLKTPLLAQVLEFKEENLVLALLNTYNMGKTEYYSLLNTMLLALGEFDDPEVKKAVIEIAHSKDYPIDIRKKAIDNLAAFNDPSVLNGLLPMLEIKENYIYYDNIINMVYSLGEEKKNAELVRRMAFKAHYTKREHD